MVITCCSYKHPYLPRVSCSSGLLLPSRPCCQAHTRRYVHTACILCAQTFFPLSTAAYWNFHQMKKIPFCQQNISFRGKGGDRRIHCSSFCIYCRFFGVKFMICIYIERDNVELDYGQLESASPSLQLRQWLRIWRQHCLSHLNPVISFCLLPESGAIIVPWNFPQQDICPSQTWTTQTWK